MKVKTKVPIKKAVHRADGTARNKLHSKPYPKAAPMSSLQSEIGILLLCLQFPIGPELSQAGWVLFERLLRRHIGLGVPPKRLSEPLQSTISMQGVSG